jgi:hypothetical protein
MSKHLNKGIFSSASHHWATPNYLYVALHDEFKFNDDPCPLRAIMTDGLSREWGTSTYYNPPYGREISKWIEKAYQESLKGKTVVMLLPSRTDTVWWHKWVMQANEIRFLRGRLSFNDNGGRAPFPSVIVVFREVLNAQDKTSLAI